MDAELKAKWVKALRSGRYTQGHGELKTPAGNYCCIGVLANIQGAKWRDRSPYIGGKLAGDGGSYSIELKPRFAGGLPKKTQNKLAQMNDGCDGVAPQSFEQIADYIEREL